MVQLPLFPGGMLTEKGYIRLWHKPFRGRYEHHVVMEARLGRKIKPGHEVHHIDHTPWNNHPSNLIELPAAHHRSHSGKRAGGPGNGNGNGSNGRRGPWDMTEKEYEALVNRGVSVPPGVRALMNLDVCPF